MNAMSSQGCSFPTVKMDNCTNLWGNLNVLSARQRCSSCTTSPSVLIVIWIAPSGNCANRRSAKTELNQLPRSLKRHRFHNACCRCNRHHLRYMESAYAGSHAYSKAIRSGPPSCAIMTTSSIFPDGDVATREDHLNNQQATRRIHCFAEMAATRRPRSSSRGI